MATAAAATIPELEIVAPGNLRQLLERHLDLARAIADQQAAAKAAKAAPPAAGASAPSADAGIEINEAEWSRLIAAAPAQARSLVQTEGFFAAQAQVQREGHHVRLTLEPGPVARVEKLVIDIQGELGESLERRDADARALHARLLADWGLPVGAPFRNADWASAKNAVIGRLRAEGYAAATWSGTSAEVITDADATADAAASGGAPARVRIFAVADSGPRFLAGGPDSITVQGLAVHDAERVRALAGFGEGAPLTETRLLDYQERLVRTGLFDQVAVSLDSDAAQAGQSRVLVQLKEAPLQNATIGLGYGTNTGPRVTGEYVHRRVFGFAATARNKIEYGRDKQAWDGEVSLHPNEHMQRWLVGGTYELLKTDEDRTISQRLRLGRAEDLPRLERLAFVQFERSNECTYVETPCIDPLTVKAASGNLHTTWRRLDNALLPTRGYTLNAQVGAGWATGQAPGREPQDQPASGPYTRLYGRATGYWPLPGGFFSEARLELGGVLVKNDVIVPDSQRFRAGGDESVRGYDYRTLAPTTPEGGITGGKLLFTASAEVAHPISRSLPSVWWAAFVDAGRAADSMGRTVDPSDSSKTLRGLREPAIGYGVGARWRSPVGPLKLDIAYGEELRQWRLHLSVGIAF
ncbi:autotransporter assembly complex protein TamA [Ideonella sp.]|uniref:autotransporter assembly complex protein TamA n=1 Tax=Ideonella sp. TaxID=1929293 RepID=UPI002B4AA0BB|nr:BamA/TamA family outer membrane protein [Ideonella sp.]